MPSSKLVYTAVPIYPVELLGKPEIHDFIPHIPVEYQTSSENSSIIMYDLELSQHTLRLGVLVSQIGESAYRLALYSDNGIPLPRSTNLSGRKREFTAEIAHFELDKIHQKTRILRQLKEVEVLKAFGVNHEEVLLGRSTVDLKGHLTGTVEVAKTKMRRYQVQKTTI